MSTCVIQQGNDDMYGLGIRIGFYMQWYAGILAPYFAPEEVPGIRLANTLFITATFIALIIKRDALQTVEVYIIILLFFGATLFSVPAEFWNELSCGFITPTTFQIAIQPTREFIFLYSLLVMSLSSFTIWFWVVRVPLLGDSSCIQYGFIFTTIRLNNDGFRIFNIVFFALLLIIMIGLFVLGLRSWKLEKTSQDKKDDLGEDMTKEKKDNRDWYHHQGNRLTPESLSDKKPIQYVDTAAKLVAAVVITIAVEKTIDWNNIGEVHSIDSAGQTIPLVIGIAAALRIFYIYYEENCRKKKEADTPVHKATRTVVLNESRRPAYITICLDPPATSNMMSVSSREEAIVQVVKITQGPTSDEPTADKTTADGPTKDVPTADGPTQDMPTTGD